MKQITTVVLMLISTVLFSQKSITKSAAIDKVNVYLNGAQLFHTTNLTLPEGPSEVIIEGLSTTLDQNSIQGGGLGDFDILDIQYRLFYPEPVENSKELTAIDKKIKLVSDSIIETDYRIKAVYSMREVLEVQKTMLMNNNLLHSTQNDSLELLQHSVLYYETKMKELLNGLLALERQEFEIQKERAGMSMRLNELINYRSQQAALANPNAPIPQVVMQVLAKSAGPATINVDYLTYNAGWYATYDIRSGDIAKPIDLTYKANIWQTTGIDWKEVEITCSTGNPMLGNTLPELTTWYLGYYQYYYQRDADDVAPTSAAESTKELDGYLSNDKKTASSAGNAAQYTTTQQTLTNVEFKINTKYKIPSDGKGHIVVLKTEKLPTTYNYLVVPKIEQSAFLIARVTGWEELYLLPGMANMYFNNSYVGRTNINPLTLADTLSLSMGRDQSLTVKRTMLADKSTDKIIGLNNKKNMAYKLEVYNSKPITVEVIVKDHIPVSQSDDIEVELIEKSGGELDEASGIITWREKIKSKQNKSWTLQFEITYPKNEPLSLY